MVVTDSLISKFSSLFITIKTTNDVYYYRTYFKAVRGRWGSTCANGYEKPRPFWTSLTTTY